MQMSNFEIRQEYRLARYPEKQIAILAQLNCCRVGDIKAIIDGREIVHPRKMYHKTADAEKRELYEQGLNDYEIGYALNIASSAVCYWRKKNGLKAIGKKGKQKC